ncbi:MAG: ribosome biogenesis GTPase Der [Verrucomicrobia bacterium]|nr:ribosome biogenesis GTPase Der [Verrucomicrobiota bacterium]
MNGLTSMPSVAIVGRPNVGKSALFNRLIGKKIAIVHDQPGITRDRISAVCTRGTRPFVLWDTGGIFGAGESELAVQVRRAAELALHEGDLLLFVVDAKAGLSPIDEELARLLRKSQKPVVLVINKIDDEKHAPLAAEFDSLGFKSSVVISAEHGRGSSDLLEAIDQHLPSPASIQHRAPSIEHPVSVAILGRPNVGKSSLINSIMRDERAIVSELAGTTRDAIDILYERNGRRFVFIDTAGIRRRGKQSTSAEVFSVMRAERSIRRADLCVLIVDITAGVTAQDKRIAGLIQTAQKPAMVVLNKWDLVKPGRNHKQAIANFVDTARERIFFLDYAPVLIASSLTGEHVSKLFGLIEKIQGAARQHLGTGVLNRLLRQAFEANPPPLVKGKRLKLFYAAQTRSGGFQTAGPMEGGAPATPQPAHPAETRGRSRGSSPLQPPEFVLFVNEPRLLNQTYGRYLECCIRQAQPFPGLPIILTLRPRAGRATPGPRPRAK